LLNQISRRAGGLVPVAASCCGGAGMTSACPPIQLAASTACGQCRETPPTAGPPEMPARLRSFIRAEWTEPDDPDEEGGSDPAHRRWDRSDWNGAGNGVPPVDIIRGQVEMRRRACGWVDGQPPRRY
jgi:hypothetical protein